MRVVRWVLAGGAAGLVLGAVWGLLRPQPPTDYSATYRAPLPSADESAGYEAVRPGQAAPATEAAHESHRGV